jgi:hypothetical protein
MRAKKAQEWKKKGFGAVGMEKHFIHRRGTKPTGISKQQCKEEEEKGQQYFIKFFYFSAQH